MKSNSIRLVAFATVILAFSAFARAGDKSPTRDKFDEVYTKYKDIVKQCADLQDRFPIADPNDRPAMAKHYDNLVAAGNQLRPTLLALAEKTYVENPADKQIADMIFAAVATFVHNDDYEEALRLGKLLIDNKYSDQHVYNLAGAAAFSRAITTTRKNISASPTKTARSMKRGKTHSARSRIIARSGIASRNSARPKRRPTTCPA